MGAEEIESLKKRLEEAEQAISRLKNNVSEMAGHDPIKDEFKKYSILEFQMELISELVIFSRLVIASNKNPQNEEQKILEHTFTEWMGSFRRWASW